MDEESQAMAEKLIEKINKEAREKINLMEVCGTHTRSIYQYGINKVLSNNINLLSGPGCPVCVSTKAFIDEAITLAQRGCLIATFGDMLRVPGSTSNLLRERERGGKIIVVYSPLSCIELAEKNPCSQVVFLGVGFETTAPSIALMIEVGKKRSLNNLSVLVSLKTMPEAMEALLLDKDIKVNGFLCPGHVATIIGTNDFRSLAEKYKVPMCISGFEAVDILSGILILINMIKNRRYTCDNNYLRAVRAEGNRKARSILEKIFYKGKGSWRGLGTIDNSGYYLKKEYEEFDALKKFSLDEVREAEEDLCICGDIIKGKGRPRDCANFGKKCTPSNPVGPCMVSMEGSCNISYNFEVI